MRTRISAILLTALAALVPAACAEKDVRYSEERGFYRAEEIQFVEGSDEGGEIDVEALLARGEEFEEAKAWESAAQYYLDLANKYPKRPLALEARRRRIQALVKARAFLVAHEAMAVTVELYKEYLQLTRNQAMWDELRRIWYEDIALGLFFKTDARAELADDLDPAIKVCERLLREEFRGKYAALCLLRVGDAYYAKENYQKALTNYLRVVKYYPDFQEAHEHQEALYKAAEARLGTMKGTDYNLDRISSPGSEAEEKGALDLVQDYLSAYPTGRYLPEVLKLRNRIYDVLAYRDLEAAQVYDRLGRDRAARYQYQTVIEIWGDPAKFPEQQTIVEKARKRLDDMGGPPNPEVDDE